MHCDITGHFCGDIISTLHNGVCSIMRPGVALVTHDSILSSVCVSVYNVWLILAFSVFVPCLNRM